MSKLKKIKKGIHLLTSDELIELEKEMYKLQDECITLSCKTPTKEVLTELAKRGKRLKQIKKILKQSKERCERLGI